MILQDKAIVLGSMLYQERSRIVYLLTENHGKLSGIARGAIHSRRFGSSFDLFNCIQLEYQEKSSRNLVDLREASTYYAFPHLRKSLDSIGTGSYFLDLCKRVTEGHAPAREIFLCLANYLFLLEKIEIKAEIIHSFELKLLQCLGCAPITNYCISCKTEINILHQKGKSAFNLSIPYGGIFCTKCYKSQENNFTISMETVLWMNKIKNIKIKVLQNTSSLQYLNELSFIAPYFQHHCNNIKIKQIPSYLMLKKLLPYSQASTSEVK